MSLEQVLAGIPPGSPDEDLARQINFEQLPTHVAIIMDGNGRWAAQRHLPRAEVNTLMLLLKRYIRLEIGSLNKNNIRFRVIGRIDDLPPDVQQELELGIQTTATNTGMLFNIALNYGGRAEIVDAARKAIASGLP